MEGCKVNVAGVVVLEEVLPLMKGPSVREKHSHLQAELNSILDLINLQQQTVSFDTKALSVCDTLSSVVQF